MGRVFAVRLSCGCVYIEFHLGASKADRFALRMCVVCITFFNLFLDVSQNTLCASHCCAHFPAVCETEGSRVDPQNGNNVCNALKLDED